MKGRPCSMDACASSERFRPDTETPCACRAAGGLCRRQPFPLTTRRCHKRRWEKRRSPSGRIVGHSESGAVPPRSQKKSRWRKPWVGRRIRVRACGPPSARAVACDRPQKPKINIEKLDRPVASGPSACIRPRSRRRAGRCRRERQPGDHVRPGFLRWEKGAAGKQSLFIRATAARWRSGWLLYSPNRQADGARHPI